MEEKKYNFEGIDWVELLDHFKIEYSDEDDDNVILDKLTEFLCETNTYGEFDPIVVEGCKKFLSALIDHEKTCALGSYTLPVWKGLLSIENDWTFMQFFTRLISFMWC